MAAEQYTATEDVFVDKDGNRVDAGDVNKMTKVVSKGGSIPLADARKYGLGVESGAEKEANAGPGTTTGDEGEPIDEVEESARVQASAGGAAYTKAGGKKAGAKAPSKKK